MLPAVAPPVAAPSQSVIQQYRAKPKPQLSKPKQCTLNRSQCTDSGLAAPESGGDCACSWWMCMCTPWMHGNPRQPPQPPIAYAEQQMPSDNNTVCGSNTWDATLVKIGAPSHRRVCVCGGGGCQIALSAKLLCWAGLGPQLNEPTRMPHSNAHCITHKCLRDAAACGNPTHTHKTPRARQWQARQDTPQTVAVGIEPPHAHKTHRHSVMHTPAAATPQN